MLGGLGGATRAPADATSPLDEDLPQAGDLSRPRVVVGFHHGSNHRRPTGEDADDGRRVYAAVFGDPAGALVDQPSSNSWRRGKARRRIYVRIMALSLSPALSRIGVEGPAYKRSMSIRAAPGRMGSLKVS